MALALAGAVVGWYPLLGTLTVEESATIAYQLLTPEERYTPWPNTSRGPNGTYDGRRWFQVAEALRAMREGRDPVPYLGRHAAAQDPNPASTEWLRPA